MNDDTVKLVGSLAGVLFVIAVVLGINQYNAHRPCSDFRNESVRYVPLRCLPGSP